MLRNKKAKLVLIVVIIQMAFFATWYSYESGAFSKPIATIKVKTIAYDPRDLLSGQYIRINYEFSRPDGRWDRELKKTIKPEWAEQNYYARNSILWLVLQKNPESDTYEPKGLYDSKPTNTKNGEYVIKGLYKRHNFIEYGIEKYFVPEGTKEPNRNDTIVELDVYNGGKVRINQVLVNGKIWP